MIITDIIGFLLISVLVGLYGVVYRIGDTQLILIVGWLAMIIGGSILYFMNKSIGDIHE